MRGKNHPISLLFTRHDDFVKLGGQTSIGYRT
ncbi:hypothetical protein V6Z11_D06G136600 [Gossypium hirsutum]